MVDPRAVSSLVSLAGHLSISSFHSCQVKSKKTWESPLQSPLLHPQRGKLIRATYLPLCRRAQLLLRSPPPAPSPGLIISRDSTRNSDSGGGDYPEGKQGRSLLWIVQFLFSSRPLSRSYNRPTDRPQTEVERATNMNMAWKEARKAAALFVKPPSRPSLTP